MLHRLVVAVVALAALLGGLVSAQADVVIVVNKSTQRLSVSVDGVPRYEWPVSTARMGYNTPNGTYGVERMAVSWFSRKYDWSPMPHSIFFDGGYAIHGSYEISRIGTPASHGCIRLHPNNAAVLYRLVEQHRNSTRIVVTGERPSGLYTSSLRHPRAERYSDRSYYEDDTVRPPRSLRGQRARSRAHDFEEIFNQAGDEAAPLADQDLGVQHYWNR